MPKQELWKDVKGYEGKYQVSTQGHVRSLNRTVTNSRGRKQSFKEKLLKPEQLYDGYERVCLYLKGKRKRIRVATLVFETFIGPIQEGLEIDHINGNNRDNRPENLRCCSHKDNCNNPITIERNRLADAKRSQYKKEWWAKKKAASIDALYTAKS